MTGQRDSDDPKIARLASLATAANVPAPRLLTPDELAAAVVELTEFAKPKSDAPPRAVTPSSLESLAAAPAGSARRSALSIRRSSADDAAAPSANLAAVTPLVQISRLGTEPKPDPKKRP